MSDRISKLPDSLLLHILSSKSLQTKDVVVATTLLSKSWRSLWHSIPKLEFHDRRFHSYESFLQSIDIALNLVDLKFVKMFVLKCERFDVSYDKVDTWVNELLRSKLEYLNLWFPCGFYFQIRVPLPSSFFKCSSIRILKLTRANVSYLTTVNLPSLKTLHLTHVEFSDARSFAMLLSNCVRVEELLVLFPELPEEYENTKLDIGRLHHLVFALVTGDLFPVQAFSKVTFLRLARV